MTETLTKSRRRNAFDEAPVRPAIYTPDGLQFVDAFTGQPPHLDGQGRLTESFTVTLEASGARELWAAGVRFTLQTPKAARMRRERLASAKAGRKLSAADQVRIYWEPLPAQQLALEVSA